jgi:hypothetical protein
VIEHLRWLELLSYLHTFIYHEREIPEQQRLQGVVETSARSTREQQEVSDMGQKIVDMFREQGAVRALRETLLRQLRRRFKQIPAETEQILANTNDLKRLQEWSDRFATAKSLKQVSITAEG